MRRALAEVAVTGVQTTLPFDRWLMGDPVFGDPTGAALSTDWVLERWDGPSERAAAEEAAAIAAAALARPSPTASPATRPEPSLRKDGRATPWRAHARRAMTDRWPR
jgi:acetyl/propionyl-CoA carboxylase alpha subunit